MPGMRAQRLLAMVMLLTAAMPAWAQQVREVARLTDSSRSYPGWLAPIIAAVLVACIIAASFVGSKRGHQD